MISFFTFPASEATKLQLWTEPRYRYWSAFICILLRLCVCVCSSCREQMLNPAVTAVLQCRKLTAGLQFSVHMIFFFLCYFYFELLVFMFSWVKLNQYQVSISSHSEFVFQNNCTLKLYRISSNSYFEIQTQTELIWSQKLFLCFLCDVFIYIVKRLQWTGFTQALYKIWKIVFQVSS